MIRRGLFHPFAALAAALLAAPAAAQQAVATLAAGAPRTEVLERGAVDPAVSPDGAQVAASILGTLWLVPINGGDAVQVTTGGGVWDTHPAWSPDGQFLAFARNTRNGSVLMEHNLATGAARSVLEVEGTLGHIAYHPGGTDFFYVLTRGQYDAHLWRLPRTGGSEPRQLTHTQNWHEWSFALSPRADTVFLESGRYGGADLYLLGMDSLRATRLTQTPETNEFSVAWSGDGRTRMWVVGRNGMDTVMAQTDGAAPRAVYASPYGQKQLSIEPAGRFAVVADGRRLVRIDLRGGAAAPIPFRAALSLPARAPGDLAIVNARVWTGVDDRVMEDATVEVRGGRIARVHRGAPEAGLPVLDAEGKTLIPGLVDNHAHYWFPFQGERLLERGVTSVRDPGAPISTSMNFKDANRLGVVLGPTIYTAGPLIDAPGGYHPMVDVAIEDPAAAPALVQALKEQGVDLLKLYFLLDPEVGRAILAEAERQGLPVTGHIGVRMSLREAVESGIDGFSHIRVWRDVLPLEMQPQGENETLDREKAPLARMQADWSLIDPEGPELGGLLRRMAERGVALDPTLTVQRIGDRDRARFSLAEHATASESYRRMSRFVRRAHESGVMLLAGTDGGSLNDEMEAYVDAGVPVIDVLRAATVNGARWLGREDEFGTIQPGRRADLLLVDGDPLQNIRDARNISAVIKEGRIVVRK
ncbi:MAG TPA: amidohydrolase family protein [Longimicrobium sp.]|nr:amidohydrolase family protein [Longimicrobium sp.]